MKIFIDSADIEEIKEAMSWGIVDGVTTNPSLIKKAVEKYKQKDMMTYIRAIFSVLNDLPVSLEVISTKHEDMLEEALRLQDLFDSHGDVVIKIPVNTAESEKQSQFEGVKTIKALADEGIHVNATLVMSPEQALMAAKAGARYVSPFAGRIDDFLRNTHGIKFEKTDYYEACKEMNDKGISCGVELVQKIRKIFANFDFSCEIIAASMRNPRQVRECALVNADIATTPFPVLKQMMMHSKTVEGIKKFKADVVPEYRKIFK